MKELVNFKRNIDENDHERKRELITKAMYFLNNSNIFLL